MLSGGHRGLAPSAFVLGSHLGMNKGIFLEVERCLSELVHSYVADVAGWDGLGHRAAREVVLGVDGFLGGGCRLGRSVGLEGWSGVDAQLVLVWSHTIGIELDIPADTDGAIASLLDRELRSRRLLADT